MPVKRVGSGVVFMIVAAALWSGAFLGRAAAVDSVEVKNASGVTVFAVHFYGTADGTSPNDKTSTWNLGDAEKEAVIRGVQYWADRVLPTGDVSSHAVDVYVTTKDDEGIATGGTTYGTGGEYYIPAVLEQVNPAYDRKISGQYAYFDIGKGPNGYDVSENSQAIEGRDERDGWNLQALVTHEMAHGMGISGGVSGLEFQALQSQDSDGSWFFNGTQAAMAYGDGSRRAVPMNSASSQPNSHFGLTGSVMSHLLFRNYPGLTEVEMASLNDIGYQIDLRDFFGRSIYTDGNTIVNTRGYFARDAHGYVDRKENKASYGLGLHVYGSGNKVTQKADLLANGLGGGGIRVDGVKNEIIIDSGVAVSANGKLGVGVLFAYGKDHVLVNRGSITATGEGGDAVRFDFGTNHGMLNGDFSSYLPANYYVLDDPLEQAEWDAHAAALAGAMVTDFDITGSIAGKRSAIYIGRGAHVENINIMSGAAIDGDIISDYYYNLKPSIPARETNLTFGRAADAAGRATSAADDAFDFTITGKILGNNNTASTGYYTGRGMLNLVFAGGKTTAAATSAIRANDITLNAGAALAMEAGVEAARNFAMTDAVLGYSTSARGMLAIGGNGAFAGTNTLDFSDFVADSYTILQADGALNRTGAAAFGKVTIQGKDLSARHSVDLSGSTAQAIVAVLTKNNGLLAWNGGKTDWDKSALNWTYGTGADAILDAFIDGDHLVFDGTGGSVATAAGNEAGRMELKNGADHVFTGNAFAVKARGGMNGELSVRNASAAFGAGFAADSFTAAGSALSWGAASSAGTATLHDVVLNYAADGSPTLTISGSAGVTGTNTLNLVNAAASSPYAILSAGALNADAASTFTTFKLNGADLTGRQNVAMSVADNSLIATLTTDGNLQLRWKGGDGVWDAGLTNRPWLDGSGGGESFVVGDKATFDGVGGDIAVAAGVRASDMEVKGGATHTFTGAKVLVDKTVATTLASTGTLSVRGDGTKAAFASGFAADNLTVDGGSSLTLGTNATVATSAALAHGATLGVALAGSDIADAMLGSAGSATLGGSNTLDLDQYAIGEYAIVSAVDGIANGNADGFDAVTVAGLDLTSRQEKGISWAKSDINNIILTLTAANQAMIWNGVNGGVWNSTAAAANWLDPDSANDAFMDGDKVVFKDSVGSVDVAYGVKTSDMTLDGANHTFANHLISVSARHSSTLSGAGALTLTNAAKGVFSAGFAADALRVDDATLQIGTASTVSGDAVFTNATYVYELGGPILTVTGTTNFSGTDNTLDLTQLAAGTYTIITGGGFNRNGFDLVTNGGEVLAGPRYLVSWGSDAEAIELSLAIQNLNLDWKGESGVWGATRNWEDNNGSASASAAESFAVGDVARFAGGTGSISVAMDTRPADMIFADGADYTFAGSSLTVSNAANPDASGSIVVNGARAVFQNAVTAGRLAVGSGGTFGVSGATATIENDAGISGGTINVHNLAAAPSPAAAAFARFAAPAAGVAPSLDVKGNAVFDNATVNVLTSQTASAFINVEGTATVDGGVVNFSGVQRRGMQYTFLTAGDLVVNNEFALGILAGGTGSLFFGANDYWLQMSGKPVSYEEMGAGGNVGRRALGAYLDRLSEGLRMTDDLNNVLFQMDNMSEAAARDTMNRLLGDVYGTAAVSSFQQSTVINNTLSNTLRGGMAAKAAAENARYGRCGVMDVDGRGNVWGAALGYYGSVGGDVGYDRHLHGGIAGVDFRFLSNFRVGAFGSFGYGRTTLDDVDEKLTSDEYMFGLYAVREWNRGYVLANAGVGYNDYDATRRIDGLDSPRTAKGEFDAVTSMAYLEAGMKLNPGVVRLQPYLGAQYSGHHQKGFGETGADSVALRLDRQNAYSVRTQTGVRAEYDVMRQADSALTLNAEGAWMHEWRDQAPGSYAARFGGGLGSADCFVLEGVDPRSDWGVVKAGVSYEKKDFRVYAEYNAYLNGRQRVQGWQVGASLSF